jgi:L-alanine-DL-glutamate epimerase-like enolase superfamily enzyme
MAGLSEALPVCETAHAHWLPVAPHADNMSQVQVHLAYAHRPVALLEHIPWIKGCFTIPAEVADGHFAGPRSRARAQRRSAWGAIAGRSTHHFAWSACTRRRLPIL